MATRTRKVDIEIGSEAKGSGFKDTDRELSKLGDKLRKTGKESGEQSGDGFMSGFQSKMTEKSKGLGSWLKGVLGKEFELSALTIGTGFSAQLVGSIAAGLASGAAKVAHGAAAIGALLPAAIGAGVMAFATLKLAVSGVGDALSAGLAGDTEAFDEALKKLSPSAQEFARSVAGMKGQLDGLKSTVQESFFAPFAQDFRPLGEIYLPAIEGSLGRVAGEFGMVAKQFMVQAQYPAIVDAITGAMGNMEIGLGNLAEGAISLFRAFLPLVTVGASFLPGLTAGFGSATAQLASFMIEAERTGRLHDFISGGLSAIGDLWKTLQQVGRILSDIGAIGASALDSVGGAFSGLGIQTGGLLDTIEGITSKVADFVSTAKGSETVGTIFETLGMVIAGALGWLQRIAQLIGRVFGPIMPQIAALFEAIANLKVAFIDALEPALVAIGGVLGNTIIPGLTSLAELLTRNKPLLQGIGIAIATLLLPSTIAWAAATLAATLPWLLLGAVIAGFAALVIIHFDTIKNVVMGVFNWVRDNWQTLLIILTGPIGAAVVLIVAHWDTIKNAVMAVFNWVKDNWQLLLGILTGPIGLAVMFITGSFDSVVSFVTGLPGRITAAATGMWDGIKDAFRSMVNTIIGWWNNISFKLPSITIPGFDPPGPGPSFGGTTIGGQTFSTPDIPYLAQGAIIQATPGGILARVGEGRHDEAVVPLDGHHGVGGDTYVVNVYPQGHVLSARDLIGVINEGIAEGHALRDRGRRL